MPSLQETLLEIGRNPNWELTERGYILTLPHPLPDEERALWEDLCIVDGHSKDEKGISRKHEIPSRSDIGFTLDWKNLKVYTNDTGLLNDFVNAARFEGFVLHNHTNSPQEEKFAALQQYPANDTASLFADAAALEWEYFAPVRWGRVEQETFICRGPSCSPCVIAAKLRGVAYDFGGGTRIGATWPLAEPVIEHLNERFAESPLAIKAARLPWQKTASGSFVIPTSAAGVIHYEIDDLYQLMPFDLSNNPRLIVRQGTVLHELLLEKERFPEKFLATPEPEPDTLHATGIPTTRLPTLETDRNTQRFPDGDIATAKPERHGPMHRLRQRFQRHSREQAEDRTMELN